MKIIYLVVQNTERGDYHAPMAAFTNKEIAQKLADEYNANTEFETKLVGLVLDGYALVVGEGLSPFDVQRRNNKLFVYSNVPCNIQDVIWARNEDEAKDVFLRREAK